MPRTKHVYVAVVILVVFVLLVLVYTAKETKNVQQQDQSSASTSVEFVISPKKELEVSVFESSERETKQHALKEELENRFKEGSFTLSTESEIPETFLESASTANETESGSSATIPDIWLYLDTGISVGIQGSYCWDMLCADVLLDDIPGEALPLLAKTSIRTELKSEGGSVGIQMKYSLMDYETRTQLYDTELLLDEYAPVATFTVPDLPGTYLLMFHAVWEGGNDVMYYYKVRII